MSYTTRQEFMQRRQSMKEIRKHQKEVARKAKENLCFNCYHRGHKRFERCPNKDVIACSNCFQMNVFTNRCQCQNPERKFPGQTLKRTLKIYID